jgi:hypothetical protein
MQKDKKSPKETASIFKAIIKASVSGNPKPKKKAKRTNKGAAKK